MNILSVIMTKGVDGSPDGVSVNSYKKGTVYDLPEALAITFIEDLDCAEYYEPQNEEASNNKEDVGDLG